MGLADSGGCGKTGVGRKNRGKRTLKLPKDGRHGLSPYQNVYMRLAPARGDKLGGGTERAAMDYNMGLLAILQKWNNG